MFEPLVALAKARTVARAEEGALALDDAEFLLRALLDLEADGAGLFGCAAPAGAGFYAAVSGYLVARAGASAADPGLLSPAAAEALAVSRLPVRRRALDDAVDRLVSHEGAAAMMNPPERRRTSVATTSERTAYGNLIGGAIVPSAGGETYERPSPADPADVIGPFARAGAEDAAAAVDAAAKAAAAWAATPAAVRGRHLAAAARALEARLDRVAADMAREMGKPIREARGEAARGVAILDFFAAEGLRSVGEVYEQSANGNPVYTLRRPLGVVALITPWNFPLAIPLWKAGPALVYGNAVVLKLAWDAPRTGLHVAECFLEAGLPAGVLNVLTGPGSTVGSALVADPRVAAISFTGSVPVGTAVREQATARGARVQLELGGQNPLIVAADARLDAAVEAAYAGAFWSAGQKCTATRRIYVAGEVYDAFRTRFLERVAAGRVGDPSDPQTEVGPLVNERQLDDVLTGVERGRAEGGEVAAGGGRLDRPGFFLAPTVFEGVADEAFLSTEEVFGPVTSLYRFDDLDEAIARANAVRFGLAASVYTQSIETAQRFVRGLRAGILHVNSQTAGAEAHVPFGGLKSSGYGPHEQGRAALEFYTDVVTVYQDA